MNGLRVVPTCKTSLALAVVSHLSTASRYVLHTDARVTRRSSSNLILDTATNPTNLSRFCNKKEPMDSFIAVWLIFELEIDYLSCMSNACDAIIGSKYSTVKNRVRVCANLLMTSVG